MVSLICRHFFRSSIALVISLLSLCVVAFTQANPNAPTASDSPEEIDALWQKATAKYDAARSAILERVDQANAKGTFRPDWESLQHFEVPEWYKDAKFGIFIHWGVYSVPAFG